MKDLYNIIKESLFDEEDMIDGVDASVWLSRQDSTYARGCVKNGKLEMDTLRITNEKNPEIIQGIKFSHIKDLQLYNDNSNYDYSKFPEVDIIDYCFVNPSCDNLTKIDIDLSGLRVNSIDELIVNTPRISEIYFPECKINKLFIGHVYACVEWEYNSDNEFDYDEIKYANPKTLLVGDTWITKNPRLFASWRNDKIIEKDSLEYDIIDKFMKCCKNLYIKNDFHGTDYKFHRVTKIKDGFKVSKKGYISLT